MAKLLKLSNGLSQSPKSWEDTAKGAADEASKTLRNYSLALHQGVHAEWTTETLVTIRVNAKVTFDLERE
jgi:dodecin